MSKLLLATVIGLAAGIAGTYLAFIEREAAPGDGATVLVRNLADVPKLSQADARQHRENGYADLHSIEQILALPTPFAQSEALYQLAGRSDSASLQNLIFDANRIADENDRDNALKILFFRLTELDAESALALSRTDFFAGDSRIDGQIWMAWAKLDFDAAIAGAGSLPTAAERSAAAQSLYQAFGDMGNAITDRIEAELGIPPDQAARTRYLYRTADRSPTEAIDYINGMENSRDSSTSVSTLASYLARKDPAVALIYTEQFDSASHRSIYERIVASHQAKADPTAILNRLLASGGSAGSDLSSTELRSAMETVAAEDLDAALSYFAQIRTAKDRQIAGQAIVTELARRDVEEALIWVRQNDSPEYPRLEMQLLRTVAETNPDKAVQLAISGDNSLYRGNLIGNVLSVVGREDPLKAMAYLEQIPGPQNRKGAAQSVLRQWTRTDPDAAVNWMLSRNDEQFEELLEHSSHTLIRSNIDVAMRLLPRIQGGQGTQWRYQIALGLVSQRSAQEAFKFVGQFEGQPEYDELRSAVITGVAQSDPHEARQLADQLPGGASRDAAYTNIIGQYAQRNPREAASWLGAIADEQQLRKAAGSLAAQWHSNEPAAAQQWLAQLPDGAARDGAIVGLAWRWEDATEAQRQYIDSIEDAETRGEALANQIMAVMRSDRDRARQMLDAADIPEHQRRRLESILSRAAGSRYYRVGY